MVIRVNSVAERDKLAGRAPQAPAAPVPVPAPAPQPTVPAPAAPLIDEEARKLIRATNDQLRALSQMMAENQRMMQQAQARIEGPPPAAFPAPAPTPEPVAPAPAPVAASRYIGMPMRPPGEAAPVPAPAPAPAAPAPTGPITATIVRDKKDRLASVSITGATTIGADIARDMQDRISEITIHKGGKKHRAVVKRDSKKRIESITLQHIEQGN